jgi:hypothetical protein
MLRWWHRGLLMYMVCPKEHFRYEGKDVFSTLWEFFQRHGLRWWDESWTFRDWVGQYISPDVMLSLDDKL